MTMVRSSLGPSLTALSNERPPAMFPTVTPRGNGSQCACNCFMIAPLAVSQFGGTCPRARRLEYDIFTIGGVAELVESPL